MAEKKRLFSNTEELIEAAKKAAKNSDPEFNQSVQLYFIARYFVSLYEARYGSIPIQVWNEYRSALDHFLRSQIGNLDKAHLKKMEGHLQRAALDILKILVHSTLDSVKEWKNTFSVEIYELVDNGSFRPMLIYQESEARTSFEIAKISDAKLGEDAHYNNEILALYLEASFKADDLKLMLIGRQNDFIQAKLQYDSIHGCAHNLSIWEHYKVHILFYAGWSVTMYFLTPWIKAFLKSF